MLLDSFRYRIARAPLVGSRLLYRLQEVGGGFPATDWSRAVAQIKSSAKSGDTTTVSVDVYDTCIVRSLATDRPIEALIERLSTTNVSPAEMAEVLERELCHPVPGVAEHLAELRTAGLKIVFLSDTDRSSKLLTEILSAHGIFVAGDQLIASCEAEATKSDGDLFAKVWPSGAAAKTWHIGNHRWSDVTMSAAAGLRPIHAAVADTNRYEQAMSAQSSGYGPALAGAARMARLEIDQQLHKGELDSHRANLQTLGANVSGQAISAFILWITERCRELGIEHLSFLARDGELPYEIARSIPGDHWEDRQLNYLHCSRLTWSLAAAAVIGLDEWLRTGTKDEKSFLVSKQHEIPFESLLARVGLSIAEVAELEGYGQLKKLAGTEALPVQDTPQWLELLGDAKVQALIDEKSSERLELIVDHLRSLDLPNGKVGLVDVGWSGRLASHVSAVLGKVVGNDIVHFHFGGENVQHDLGDISIKRFVFDGINDPRPITNPVSCVETLTASGKPRVVGYHRLETGQVEAQFDTGTNVNPQDRNDMWAGAMKMASLIPSRKTLDGWQMEPVSLATEAKAVLDLWWNHPTENEVKALSRMTFEHDEAGTVLRPLVVPYKLSEFNRDRGTTRRQWSSGSAVASQPMIARALSCVWALRRFKSRLISS